MTVGVLGVFQVGNKAMDVREFAKLGGIARAKKLTKARRSEIAKKAGEANAKRILGVKAEQETTKKKEQ